LTSGKLFQNFAATVKVALFSLCVFLLAIKYIDAPAGKFLKTFAGNVIIAVVWLAGIFFSYKCSLFFRRKKERIGSFLPGICLPTYIWILVLGAGLFPVLLGKLIPFFYFLNWPLSYSELGRNRKMLSMLFIILSWGAVPFFIFFKPVKWVSKFLATGLLASQLRSCWLLLKRTGFTTPYSDDHPSFLFRIAEFFTSFPWRENFVPYWNAGVVNSVLTSSGTPGIALLGTPLFLFMPPHEAMLFVFIFVFIFFIPWMTVWGLRSAGMSVSSALVGGILALCADRFYFKWLLHFGTVGAMLACAMLPAAFAFLYAAMLQPRAKFSTYLGLTISMFFMTQWPPMLMLGAPLGLFVAFNTRKWWFSERRTPFLITCLIICILILPTIISTLSGKMVMEYVLTVDGETVNKFDLIRKQVHAVLYEIVLDSNPLLLFLGFGSLLTIPLRRLRNGLAVMLAAIFLISVLGPVYLPNLQLSRMTFEASYLMIVPAGLIAGKTLERYSVSGSMVQSILIALLVCSLVNAPKFYGGRDEISYYGIRPIIQEFTSWINENVPEDGRLVFAGPSVHAYGRGHTAYLPLLSGREMMGCDYYGFPPGMVEYDYPPRATRNMPGGIHRFMTLHGASHVIAYEQRYIDYFRSEPELFEEDITLTDPAESKNNVYVIFRITGAEGRFYEGSGKVKATFNKINVSFENAPPERVVVRYNWNDRFEAKPPVRLFPFDTGEGAIFIGVEPNGVKDVCIRYRSKF
jgi:hypothetical protein